VIFFLSSKFGLGSSVTGGLSCASRLARASHLEISATNQIYPLHPYMVCPSFSHLKGWHSRCNKPLHNSKLETETVGFQLSGSSSPTPTLAVPLFVFAVIPRPWADVDRKDVTRWPHRTTQSSCPQQTLNRCEAGRKLPKKPPRNLTERGSCN